MGIEYQAPNLEDPHRAASELCLCRRPGKLTKFTVNLISTLTILTFVYQLLFCLRQKQETVKFLDVFF